MEIESYSFTRDLPPQWLGNLTAHLAAHHMDVDSVRAELADGGIWKVDVTVHAQFPPSERELVAMALLKYDVDELRRGPLARYFLRRSDDTLHLVLRAENRTGFLARLCADLAAHALFPVRVDARSADGWIDDGFWLRGIGHAPPHAETEAALQRFLEAWQSGHLLRHPSLRPPSSGV